MQLELSDPETKLLKRIIDDYYLNLREEIYKTETPDVKDQLKAEEQVVMNLLSRLGVSGNQP